MGFSEWLRTVSKKRPGGRSKSKKHAGTTSRPQEEPPRKTHSGHSDRRPKKSSRLHPPENPVVEATLKGPWQSGTDGYYISDPSPSSRSSSTKATKLPSGQRPSARPSRRPTSRSSSVGLQPDSKRPSVDGRKIRGRVSNPDGRRALPLDTDPQNSRKKIAQSVEPAHVKIHTGVERVERATSHLAYLKPMEATIGHANEEEDSEEEAHGPKRVIYSEDYHKQVLAGSQGEHSHPNYRKSRR